MRSTLAAAALCAVAAQWLALHDWGAKQRSDVSFYGASRLSWASQTSFDATTESGRRFPAVLSGPEAAGEGRGHRVRLVFGTEPGYRIAVRLIQSDSSKSEPPRLELALNGGIPVTLQVARGAGLDPLTVERAFVADYSVEFDDRSLCGDNELVLTAARGDWVAIERIDLALIPSHPVQRLNAVAALALAIVVVAVVRRSGPALTDPGRIRMGFARLLVIGTATAMALALAEAALRIISRSSPSLNQLVYSSIFAEALPDTPEILTALKAHRCAQAGCSLYDGRFRLNRHGFHTGDYEYAKPPGVTRVLGIGDSFMFYGGPVPHEESFFVRLEHELRSIARPGSLELINLGMNCLGIPSERALLLQEGLRVQPDVIVWAIYTGNDIADETSGNFDQLQLTQSKLRRWLERSLLYRLVSHVGSIAVHDSRLVPSGCSAPAAATAQAPATGPLQCGVLENAVLDQPYNPSAKLVSDEQFFNYGVDHLHTMYAEAQQPWMRGLVGRLLDQLQDARERLGSTPLLIVVIPDQFQVSAAEVERLFAARPALRTERFDFQQAPRAVVTGLTELGFHVLDLRESFVESIRAGADPYHPNDSHLSVVGNRIVAGRIGAALQQFGPLSESPLPQ